MAKYVLIDCCPVPRKLAPVIRIVKHDSGATLNSCYRGKDARALLHKCGKKDQAELYEGWRKRLPGFNPANRPGRSTHELRNDGVAYWGWAGRILRYFQVGQDWDDTPAVIRAYRRHGWIATLTYPNNPGERQHVNLRKEPKIKRKSLRVGSKGRRVVALTRRLAYVKSPRDHEPYLTHRYQTFTHEVEHAVKAFQREHHLKADGVAGPATLRQLAASTRWWKRYYKRNKKS